MSLSVPPLNRCMVYSSRQPYRHEGDPLRPCERSSITKRRALSAFTSSSSASSNDLGILEGTNPLVSSYIVEYLLTLRTSTACHTCSPAMGRPI